MREVTEKVYQFKELSRNVQNEIVLEWFNDGRLDDIVQEDYQDTKDDYILAVCNMLPLANYDICDNEDIWDVGLEKPIGQGWSVNYGGIEFDYCNFEQAIDKYGKDISPHIREFLKEWTYECHVATMSSNYSYGRSNTTISVKFEEVVDIDVRLYKIYSHYMTIIEKRMEAALRQPTIDFLFRLEKATSNVYNRECVGDICEMNNIEFYENGERY